MARRSEAPLSCCGVFSVVQRRYTKELLSEAVAVNTTMVGVLRSLGVDYVSGHIYSHLKRKIREFGIDTSHMLRGKAWAKGKPDSKRRSAASILVRSSNPRREDTHRLRRALLEIGIKHECSECGQGPEWRGRPLVLPIDHKDGDRQNHEALNLRFLCPNCHAQTPTYGRKNLRV
jgi:hypothetical protein